MLGFVIAIIVGMVWGVIEWIMEKDKGTSNSSYTAEEKADIAMAAAEAAMWMHLAHITKPDDDK